MGGEARKRSREQLWRRLLPVQCCQIQRSNTPSSQLVSYLYQERERKRERERGPSFSPYRSASLFCIPIVPSSLYDLALYVFILFYFAEFLCLLVGFRPFSWNSRLLGYRLITSSYTKKDSLERPLCCFLQTRSRTRAKRRWEAAAILGRSARETAAFGK